MIVLLLPLLLYMLVEVPFWPLPMLGVQGAKAGVSSTNPAFHVQPPRGLGGSAPEPPLRFLVRLA